MAVWLRDRFIFLANPRTGSMATEAALLTLPGAKRIHNHHAQLHEVIGGDIVGIQEIIFTTVRSHWDALPTWFELAHDEPDWFNFLSKWRHSHFWKLVNPPWVDGKVINKKIARRCLWWFHRDVTHHILRYETLQEDLNHVLSLAHLNPVELPRMNVTKNKKPWQEYWDSFSINYVWDHFGWEMTEYGYQKIQV